MVNLKEPVQINTADLDPARQEKARELSRTAYMLKGMEVFFGLVYISFFLFSGISTRLRDSLPYPGWLSAAFIGLIFLLVYTILTLPLDYYQSKVLPQRFGLSHPGLLGLWVMDKLKGIIILLFLSLLVISILYFLISISHYWWLLAGMSFSLVSLLMTILLPDLFLRLFYRLEPIKDQDLKQRLISMSAKAGSKVLGVYSLDFSRRGTMANAMLAGQGVTKKILLSDTLLKDYPPDEIEVILAHELGHHKLHHTWKLLVITFLFSLIGFYLVDMAFSYAAIPGIFNIQDISDPAGLPLIVTVYSFFSIIISPLLLAYSRYIEKQADIFSLRISGKAAAFISSENRLANQNLLKSRPGWLEEVLFLDHPPHYKRVQSALEYQEIHAGKHGL